LLLCARVTIAQADREVKKISTCFGPTRGAAADGAGGGGQRNVRMMMIIIIFK